MGTGDLLTICSSRVGAYSMGGAIQGRRLIHGFMVQRKCKHKVSNFSIKY